jgi:pantoate--beta-alanine ligase
MEIINRRQRMASVARKTRREEDKTIGLVPTMGALHDGHLSLVREARRMCDVVVVSVFVNPTQFGPGEDFQKYPRDLTKDTTVLADYNVDYIFAPSVDEVYPRNFSTYVTVEGLSEQYEGASRPGHFRGVATVLAVLFNTVRPDFAFFGQKDAQQTLVVRRLVRDLAFDTEVVVLPTVREDSGLALSSRNAYLDATSARRPRSSTAPSLTRARPTSRASARRSVWPRPCARPSNPSRALASITSPSPTPRPWKDSTVCPTTAPSSSPSPPSSAAPASSTTSSSSPRARNGPPARSFAAAWTEANGERRSPP